MSKTITCEKISGTNEYLIIIHKSATGGLGKEVAAFEKVTADKLEEVTERLKSEHGIGKHGFNMPNLSLKGDKTKDDNSSGRI